MQVAVAVLYLHDVEQRHGRENLSVVHAGSVVAITGLNLKGLSIR